MESGYSSEFVIKRMPEPNGKFDGATSKRPDDAKYRRRHRHNNEHSAPARRYKTAPCSKCRCCDGQHGCEKPSKFMKRFGLHRLNLAPTANDRNGWWTLEVVATPYLSGEAMRWRRDVDGYSLRRRVRWRRLDEIARQLNQRPRRTLDYETPAQ